MHYHLWGEPQECLLLILLLRLPSSTPFLSTAAIGVADIKTLYWLNVILRIKYPFCWIASKVLSDLPPCLPFQPPPLPLSSKFCSPDTRATFQSFECMELFPTSHFSYVLLPSLEHSVPITLYIFLLTT